MNKYSVVPLLVPGKKDFLTTQSHKWSNKHFRECTDCIYPNLWHSPEEYFSISKTINCFKFL